MGGATTLQAVYNATSGLQLSILSLIRNCAFGRRESDFALKALIEGCAVIEGCTGEMLQRLRLCDRSESGFLLLLTNSTLSQSLLTSR